METFWDLVQASNSSETALEQAYIKDKPTDEIVLNQISQFLQQKKIDALIKLRHFLAKKRSPQSLLLFSLTLVIALNELEEGASDHYQKRLQQQLSLQIPIIKASDPIPVCFKNFFISLYKNKSPEKLLKTLGILLKTHHPSQLFNPFFQSILPQFCEDLSVNSSTALHKWISEENHKLIAEALYAYPDCLIMLSFPTGYIGLWNDLSLRALSLLNHAVEIDNMPFYALRLLTYHDPKQLTYLFYYLEKEKTKLDEKNNYEYFKQCCWSLLKNQSYDQVSCSQLLSQTLTNYLTSPGERGFTPQEELLLKMTEQLEARGMVNSSPYYLTRVNIDLAATLELKTWINILQHSINEDTKKNWTNLSIWLKHNKREQKALEVVQALLNLSLKTSENHTLVILIKELLNTLSEDEEKNGILAQLSEQYLIAIINLHSLDELAPQPVKLLEKLLKQENAKNISASSLNTCLIKDIDFLSAFYQLDLFKKRLTSLFVEFAKNSMHEYHVIALLENPSLQTSRNHFLEEAFANIDPATINQAALAGLTGRCINVIRETTNPQEKEGLISKLISYFQRVTPQVENQQIFNNFVEVMLSVNADWIKHFVQSKDFEALFSAWAEKIIPNERGSCPFARFLLKNSSISFNQNIEKSEWFRTTVIAILQESTVIKTAEQLLNFFTYLKTEEQKEIALNILQKSNLQHYQPEALLLLMAKVDVPAAFALLADHPHASILATTLLFHKDLHAQLSLQQQPILFKKITSLRYFTSILTSTYDLKLKFNATEFLFDYLNRQSISLGDWLELFTEEECSFIELLNYSNSTQQLLFKSFIANKFYRNRLQNFLLNIPENYDLQPEGFLYNLLKQSWLEPWEVFKLEVNSLKHLKAPDRNHAIILQFTIAKKVMNLSEIYRYISQLDTEGSCDLKSKITELRWINILPVLPLINKQESNPKRLEEIELFAKEQNDRPAIHDVKLNNWIIETYSPPLFARLCLSGAQLDRVDVQELNDTLENLQQHEKWLHDNQFQLAELPTKILVYLKDKPMLLNNSQILHAILSSFLFPPLAVKFPIELRLEILYKLSSPQLLKMLQAFFQNIQRATFHKKQLINLSAKNQLNQFVTDLAKLDNGQMQSLAEIGHFNHAFQLQQTIKSLQLTREKKQDEEQFLSIIPKDIPCKSLVNEHWNIEEFKDLLLKLVIDLHRYRNDKINRLDSFLTFMNFFPDQEEKIANLLTSYEALFTDDLPKIDSFLKNVHSLFSVAPNINKLIKLLKTELINTLVTTALTKPLQHKELLILLFSPQHGLSSVSISQQLTASIKQYLPNYTAEDLTALTPNDCSAIPDSELASLFFLQHLLFFTNPQITIPSRESANSLSDQRYCLSCFAADIGHYKLLTHFSSLTKNNESFAFANFKQKLSNYLLNSPFKNTYITETPHYDNRYDKQINYYTIVLNAFQQQKVSHLLQGFKSFVLNEEINVDDFYFAALTNELVNHNLTKQLLECLSSMPLLAEKFNQIIMQLRNYCIVDQTFYDYLVCNCSWNILSVQLYELHEIKLLRTTLKQQQHCSSILLSFPNKANFINLLSQFVTKDVFNLLNFELDERIHALVLAHLLTRKDFPMTTTNRSSILEQIARQQKPLSYQFRFLTSRLDLEHIPAECLKNFTAAAAAELLLSIKHFHQLKSDKLEFLFIALGDKLDSVLAFWLDNHLDSPNAYIPLSTIIKALIDRKSTILAWAKNSNLVLEKLIMITFRHPNNFGVKLSALVGIANEKHLNLALRCYLQSPNPLLSSFIIDLVNKLYKSSSNFTADNVRLLMKIAEIPAFSPINLPISQIIGHYMQARWHSSTDIFYEEGKLDTSLLLAKVNTEPVAEQSNSNTHSVVRGIKRFIHAETSSIRSTLTKDIKILDHFLLEYTGGDLKPLERLLSGYFDYFQSSANASLFALSQTSKLLAEESLDAAIKKLLFESFLRRPQLFTREILGSLLHYDKNKLLGYFGKQKDYEQIITIHQLMTGQIDNDLQLAYREANFEQEMQRMTGWFVKQRIWIKRLKFYGWHGWFSLNSPCFVALFDTSLNTTTLLPRHKPSSSLANNEPEESFFSYLNQLQTTFSLNDLPLLVKKVNNYNSYYKGEEELVIRAKISELAVKTYRMQQQTFNENMLPFIRNWERMIEIFLAKGDLGALTTLFASIRETKTKVSDLEDELCVYPELDLPPLKEVAGDIVDQQRDTGTHLLTQFNWFFRQPTRILSVPVSMAKDYLGLGGG